MDSLKRRYGLDTTSETRKKLEEISKRAKTSTAVSSPQKTPRYTYTKTSQSAFTKVITKPPQGGLTFEYLPDEVVLHIFEFFLDFKNRLTCSKVCSRWNELILHSWKQYFLHQYATCSNRKLVSQEFIHIGQKKGAEVQSSPDWRLLNFSFARFVRELHTYQSSIDYSIMLEEHRTVFEPYAMLLISANKTALPLAELTRIATKYQVVVGDRTKSEIREDIEKKLFQLVRNKAMELVKRKRSLRKHDFAIQSLLAVEVVVEGQTHVIPIQRPSIHFFRVYRKPSVFIVGELSKITNNTSNSSENLTIVQGTQVPDITTGLSKAKDGDILLLCPGTHQARELVLNRKYLEILPLDPRSKTIVDIPKIQLKRAFVRIAHLKFPYSKFTINCGSRLILESCLLIKTDQKLFEIDIAASAIIHNNVIQLPEASYFRIYPIMDTDSSLHALSIRNNMLMVPLQVFKFLKGGDEAQGWIRKSLTLKTMTIQHSVDLLPAMMKPAKKIDVAGNTLKLLEQKQTSSKPSKLVF